MEERIVVQDLVPNVRYAAKMNNYKLCGNCKNLITDLEPKTIEWELFDLSTDPQETHNLIGQGIREEQILRSYLIEEEKNYVEPNINSIFANWKKPISCLGCF